MTEELLNKLAYQYWLDNKINMGRVDDYEDIMDAFKAGYNFTKLQSEEETTSPKK